MAPSTIRFSHNHFYVDKLRQLDEYKKLEAKLNDFSSSVLAPHVDLSNGSKVWSQLAAKYDDGSTNIPQRVEYSPAGQDFVEQLLVGLGWRIIGQHVGPTTHSLVVTSRDPNGARFVVTAQREAAANNAEDAPYDHFDKRHLERYSQACSSRQGCAVLGFSVSRQELDSICQRYREKHPKLVLTQAPLEYEQDGTRIFEAYAYYAEDGQEADTGTILRFMDAPPDHEDMCVLPGVRKVDATFDEVSLPVFCDHWVSNVHSRTGFLDTLNDTLGFSPKVDFNAGVVAAGEAQIESTVTGNSSAALLETHEVALRDQSQIYLPINNALSEVGHVSTFLKEIGQGVQHVASRVDDLIAHIRRANEIRQMTGAGLSFLQIPRSYYGRLTASKLAAEAHIDIEMAESVVSSLKEAGLVDAADVVQLDATVADIVAALPRGAPSEVAKTVLTARYGNLYALLRDRLSEEQYLDIVRNNILVDVQGGDLLLQIFTSKILTRTPRDEGPFLEFIQRVCFSQPGAAASGKVKPLKPGCGGFGIRNFLTLFLSIEVTEAAAARETARQNGDAKAEALAQRMVDAFTAQLNESNPILTRISDAMTAEGEALAAGNEAEARRWSAEKDAGQAALMEVSTRYKELTKQIRRERDSA